MCFFGLLNSVTILVACLFVEGVDRVLGNPWNLKARLLRQFFSFLRSVSSLDHQCLVKGKGLAAGTSSSITSFIVSTKRLTLISTSSF